MDTSAVAANAVISLGGPQIEQAIKNCLRTSEPFAVLSIGLSHFVGYQVQYGWEKADQVMTMLAEAIRDSITTAGNAGDLVGQVLGDESMVMTTPNRAVAIAQSIIDRFDRQAPSFYSDEDRLRGCSIDYLDRRGNPIRSPIVSVAIAIISSEQRGLEHPMQIESLAREVRNYIELMPGSRFVFDRRKNDR